MTEVKLGKIKKCRVGWGGYQDAMFGVTFDLGGDGWGVGDFWGTWGIDKSERAKWTEESRIEALGNVMMRLRNLTRDSKVNTTSDLEEIPIRVTFNNMVLVSWEVLKEVL